MVTNKNTNFLKKNVGIFIINFYIFINLLGKYIYGTVLLFKNIFFFPILVILFSVRVKKLADQMWQFDAVTNVFVTEMIGRIETMKLDWSP